MNGQFPKQTEITSGSLERKRPYPTLLNILQAEAEIVQTMADLRRVECDILTIGQYLRPSAQHLPLMKYYSPEEFAELKRIGPGMGVCHVEAGPLVRSSYHAEQHVPH